MATPDQNYTDFQKAVKIILHLNKRSVYENNNVSAVVANNGHNGSPSPQPRPNGQQSPPPPSPRDREVCGAIIAIWSSLGRIDQVLTNINTLYINELENGYGAGEGGQHYVPIILFQVHNSVTFLLHKGTHVIESNHEAKWCSLVPVGAPCLVTTTGFRWNLTNDTMSFGSLISTSNEFDPECRSVRIETDRPVLFSYDISKSDPLVIPNK
ncbi:unnamed protein product [Medioppia subpectinata]|uniref:Thiamin pyrophosphokinase thiamin-binding domain-containing protein n=1 Tax=Medioppia subpectinata TaxID=1979941 RepID=A0A7R9QFE8_9ACAR|nr:unnamed protein product [Medioppia subpectinata]CAG2119100.1 unnamed protein product [Medioppia subpectinata]